MPVLSTWKERISAVDQFYSDTAALACGTFTPGCVHRTGVAVSQQEKLLSHSRCVSVSAA